MFHAHGSCVRIRRSPSASRRVVIKISEIAMSAVAFVSTPGVFVNVTPWRSKTGTSALS